MINKTRKTVTLTLTENCNLNCIYCYEHNKTAKMMEFNTAKEILDRELTVDDGMEEVIIEFFGGEPFIAFDLIKDLHSYIMSKNWPKRFLMFATTNGTLIHGEIKDWLTKNKDTFICGVSLDGTKAMHDYNRSDSFDMIDIDFFSSTWPFQKTKMTVSKHSLTGFADSIIFLHQHGYIVDCNLAYGIDWSEDDTIDILERELHKLINYYLDHPDIEPCRILSLPIQNITGEKKAFIKKWCGAGTHMHTYDINGNLYPCQFFMPLSIGDKNPVELEKLEFLTEIPIEKFDKKCTDCVLEPACPTCLGSNFHETGNMYIKNDAYCKCMKTVLLAISYFKYQQFKSNQSNLPEESLNSLLRGIKLVQESYHEETVK